MSRVRGNPDRAAWDARIGPGGVGVAVDRPVAGRGLHLAAEEAELLRRRAAILSRADRTLVLMYLEKGSRFSEIAQVSGLNEVNVARRIHKLVGRLMDGQYITCVRHRALLGTLNVAIAKDRFIEGLSVRRIVAKRRTTTYRVRRGLVQIQLLLDGRLKTEE